MNKSRVMAALVSLSVVLGAPSARAGAVIGATEPTQILNMIQLMMSYIEQAQQTVTQIQQYQSMLRNLQNMTPSALLNTAAAKLWNDQNMVQTFTNLRKVVVGGQSIDYRLATLDSTFKQIHPGYASYGSGTNYTQSYANWSDNTLSSVKNAIAMTSAQQDDFATEEGMMSELQAKSQSAGGQLEALQAGQQISLSMVGQLQKLRQLQMAQMSAQNAFMAGQQSQADAADGVMQQFLNRDQKRVRTLAEIKAQQGGK